MQAFVVQSPRRAAWVASRPGLCNSGGGNRDCPFPAIAPAIPVITDCDEASSKNALCTALADLARERLLDRKVLVAPNRRVGHQWVESVVRSGVAVVNLQVETLTAIALSLAAEEMERSGRTLASRRKRETLIELLWPDFAAAGAGYLRTLPSSAGVAAALARTIEDVRLSGLGSEDMRPQCLESGVKAGELTELLDRYTSALDDRRLLDRADVLRMARSTLTASCGGQTPQGGKSLSAAALADVYAVPDTADLTVLERDLLEALPSERLVPLATDPVCPTNRPEPYRTDRARLAWLPRPAEAPPPIGDGSVEIFAAVGEANEVREALRRCLASEIPLDEVEFVCSDTDTYAPLVRDALARLSGGSDEAEDVPVSATEGARAAQPGSEDLRPQLKATYADGLPVRLSRPGRALAAWLEWIDKSYPQLELVQMLADGLLAPPGEPADPLERAALARELRSLPVVFGLHRYVPAADETLEAARRRRASRAVPSEDSETSPIDEAEAETELSRLQVLRDWLRDKVVGSAPASDARPAEVLGAAAAWVTDVAWSRSDLDRFARDVLVEQIGEVRAVLDDSATDASAPFDAFSLVSDLVQSSRVVGSGPRPGHLHVSALHSGGHTGRCHTFVMGLDERRFPGAGLQDPLLLDSERRRLSDEIPTAAEDLEDRTENLARLLAGLRGAVTLSFPLFEVHEGREEFPSSAILAAFRILTGDTEAGQEALLAAVTPGAAFLPTDMRYALDAGELESWRLIRDPVDDVGSAVLADHPHLARGRKAIEARASDAHSTYDGHIDELDPRDDPTDSAGPPVSAGRLETAGACPLRYFFSYVLRVAPLDEPSIEGDRWLDAMQRGTLLHEVFCSFLRDLAREPSPFDLADHGDLLDRILASRIAYYRERCPPPSRAAYEEQRAELEKTCQLFLSAESQALADRRPAFMEVAVGVPPEGDGTELDRRSPLPVMLPDDTRLQVRGKIDRIDRLETDPPAWALWDYKTGSRWRYEQDPPFYQGRVLQSVVYWQMAESLLPDGGPIREVGYAFPSLQGQGARIGFRPEELTEGLSVLSHLAHLIADGAFCQTNEVGDCRYCDFVEVCGTPEANASAGGRMLASGNNSHLASMRVLRGLERD